MDPLPDFSWTKNFVTNLWSLKGGVKISAFGGALLLFDFEDSFEAKRVLARGARRLKKKILLLIRWHPEVRCLLEGRGLQRNFG